jgi:methylenetetrahydrofolate--tRNA-(uracil-5-)-methyltransferase
VISEEVTEVPVGPVIIATGPLTSDAMSEAIGKYFGESEYLHFFDAAAPLVTAESIDMNLAWWQSRYDRGTADYINCAMNREEYEAFYKELINAEEAEVHGFEDNNVFEGCMPVEVMARRGFDTLRYGPLKPVGLTNPKTGHRPWANLQLRKENTAGTMYNLVGFQTNLKFGEQKRVFSMIPALENAEFVRYGVMHRNTFIDSPRLLGSDFGFRSREGLYFAGQITGVEGYMESAASGILAGINAANRILGKEEFVPSELTMTGALARYISDESVKDFQPMGCNMGILPSLETNIRDKKLKYQTLAERSLKALDEYLNSNGGI